MIRHTRVKDVKLLHPYNKINTTCKMSNKQSDKLHSGCFFLCVPLYFISVIFYESFIDALEPQSLTVQVSGPLCCPRRAQSDRKSLPKQSELSITLYSFCQAGRECVKRFMYLCVDLN